MMSLKRVIRTVVFLFLHRSCSSTFISSKRYLLNQRSLNNGLPVLSSSDLSITDIDSLKEALLSPIQAQSSESILERAARISEVVTTIQQKGLSSVVTIPETFVTSTFATFLEDANQQFISGLQNSNFESLSFQFRKDDLTLMSDVPTQAIIENIQQLAHSNGWTLSDLIEKLNFDEFGCWYSGTVVGLFLLAACTMESKTPGSAQIRANADAALLEAKELVTSTDELQSANNDAPSSLSKLMDELSSAVQSLTAEVSDLKAKNQRTEKKLSDVQFDFNRLQRKLDTKRNSVAMLQTQITQYCQNLKTLEAKLEVSITKSDVLSEQIELMKREALAMRKPIALHRSRRITQGIWFANMAP